MIKIYIGDALEPKEVTLNPNLTVKEAFQQALVTVPTGSIITLNSRRLGDLELEATLSELNIENGDLLTVNTKMIGNKVV